MKISDRILSLLLFSVETATSPQDHRPSSRVTGVGGETDVSSMTALGADNLAVFCAEADDAGNIVSNSSPLASSVADFCRSTQTMSGNAPPPIGWQSFDRNINSETS